MQGVEDVSGKLERKLVEGDVRIREEPNRIEEIISLNSRIERKRKSLSNNLAKFNMAIEMENPSRLSHAKSESRVRPRKLQNVANIPLDDIRKILDKRSMARERLKSWKKETQEVRNIREQIEITKRLRSERENILRMKQEK